jgi:ribosomal protein S18 acetylase RimI-like enzyme
MRSPARGSFDAGIAIRELHTPEELDSLRGLWLALHHHHRQVSSFDGFVTDDGASWARRRATYADWLAEGESLMLVAHANSQPVGYLTARLQAGPDDTFAVGAQYAELYSLSVHPRARSSGVGSRLLDELDRRLKQRGIQDLSVAVLIDNVDALRFYRRRGLEPVEVVLWRIGADRRRGP